MAEQFTPEASSLWEVIPRDRRPSLLENVWCLRCGRPTTIVNFRGRVQQGDLILEGECQRCGTSVGRLIESA
jgi:hypothetical protein